MSGLAFLASALGLGLLFCFFRFHGLSALAALHALFPAGEQRVAAGRRAKPLMTAKRVGHALCPAPAGLFTLFAQDPAHFGVRICVLTLHRLFLLSLPPSRRAARAAAPGPGRSAM